MEEQIHLPEPQAILKTLLFETHQDYLLIMGIFWRYCKATQSEVLRQG